MQHKVLWHPSPRQQLLLSSNVFEAFFGGARGGGKTDGVLGEWGKHASEYGEHAVGLMVRRHAKELGETFHRARRLFEPMGAKFAGGPDTGGMVCVMPNGARLKFAHIDSVSDAGLYQGHSYTRLYVEEVGNYASPDPVLMLFATLRSGERVPCRIRLTGNPGGPGHQWVKARYIDPAPQGMELIVDAESGLERVFIPSRVGDNPHLDSSYIANIRASGSPELVRAWLEGDWSVIAGAFFPEFNPALHVVAPRTLPSYWHRFRSMDWGSARPFSVGWWAVSDGELAEFPRGAMIRYREWYGMQPGKPNVGLRLTADEVADGVVERELRDIREGQTMTGVADPAIFSEDGGPSIAHRMAMRGCHWNRADNKRVPQAGALGGWDQLRARLKGDGEKPAIYFFSTCVDTIRTLPALQHDDKRPEDVDTEAEDHAADEVRYACMSRPYTAPMPVELVPRDRYRERGRVKQRSGSGWAA